MPKQKKMWDNILTEMCIRDSRTCYEKLGRCIHSPAHAAGYEWHFPYQDAELRTCPSCGERTLRSDCLLYTSPLSMVITGMLLAAGDLGCIVRSKPVWKLAAVRMLLSPAVCLAVFGLLGFRSMTAQVVLLLECCPSVSYTHLDVYKRQPRYRRCCTSAATGCRTSAAKQTAGCPL